MGILLRPLELKNNYWVCKLPTKKDSSFIEPELMRLDLIKYCIGKPENYSETYFFGILGIDSFNDPELKIGVKYIGDFIISPSSSKIIEIIKLHITPSSYDNNIVDEKLDIEAIKQYLSHIELNRPEMLI